MQKDMSFRAGKCLLHEQHSLRVTAVSHFCSSSSSKTFLATPHWALQDLFRVQFGGVLAIC